MKHSHIFWSNQNVNVKNVTALITGKSFLWNPLMELNVYSDNRASIQLSKIAINRGWIGYQDGKGHVFFCSLTKGSFSESVRTDMSQSLQLGKPQGTFNLEIIREVCKRSRVVRK